MRNARAAYSRSTHRHRCRRSCINIDPYARWRDHTRQTFRPDKNSPRSSPKSGGVSEDHVDRTRKASDLPLTGEDPIEVVARVFRFCSFLERRLGAAFETAGLSRTEADLLAALLRSPDRLVPPSRLASALVCSTGTMTNRLDRLEKGGFIRRRPDPNDRRGVLIELTMLGRKTIATAIAARDNVLPELVPGLTLPERRQLAKLLRKLMLEIEAEPVSERARVKPVRRALPARK
jgi:DNA-binding MarR family transcriptional regulator